METKKLDIIIDAGEDFIMPFTMWDYNDVLINLTGAFIDAHLRHFATDRDFIPFEVSHNGPGGRVTIKMAGSNTERIPYSTGVYDVLITFPNGQKVKPLKGDVKILAGATR
ncbi:MAG: hypothetical protein IKS81_04725 [Verrucomicrobia bacterium]|nr:hypothetical protein [Verrucomicrobiota bacterium]